MHIHFDPQLILQRFHSRLLVEQFLLQRIDLALHFADAPDLILRFLEFLPEDLHHLQLFLLLRYFVPVPDLPFRQVALLQLDFLVEDLEFLVAFDQLLAEDVPFVDHHLVVLFLALLFGLRFGNDILEFNDMLILVFDNFLGALDILLNSLLGLLGLFVFIANVLEFEVLLDELRGLDLDFLLELLPLVLHPLVLLGEFVNFLLALQQVLGVEVAVRPDSLVEVLLVLQLGFHFLVLLLELADHVVLDLHLLDRLVVLRVGLRGLDPVLLLLLLQHRYLLVQLYRLYLVPTHLVLQLL